MHIHTIYSDGTLTPEEVVKCAYKMKLSAISITDHDSVDGIEEALSVAMKYGIELVPGIELSSEVISSFQNSEMHILGYFIDYKSKELKNILNIFKRTRYDRAIKILKKLNDNGLVLKDTSFVENAASKVIGRLHFAKALVEENLTRSIQEAFQRYLSNGKPAYVPKYYISPRDAIKIILSAGGVPVIAHPYFAHYNDRNMLRSLIKNGLMGIEVWHIKHSEDVVKKLLKLADEFNLNVTGGSDCHGKYKKESFIIGKVKVPYYVFESLKKLKRNKV